MMKLAEAIPQDAVIEETAAAAVALCLDGTVGERLDLGIDIGDEVARDLQRLVGVMHDIVELGDELLQRQLADLGQHPGNGGLELFDVGGNRRQLEYIGLDFDQSHWRIRIEIEIDATLR